MFDKAASPFACWQEGRKSSGMPAESNAGLPDDLEKRYRLKADGGKYMMTERLNLDEFRQLNERIKAAGYRYVRAERAFAREVH